MRSMRSGGTLKLSRTKIELSIKCQRCFWMDQRGSVKRPSFPPYTINSAIDYLLKQEFDRHREARTPHPIMALAGINAVPWKDERMDQWRHNFTGVQVKDAEATGIMIYGAVDDIWVTPEGELLIVDYKATGANEHKIREEYGRQMEVYQWLVAQNGLKVSSRGYFVFARVNKGGGFSEEGKGSLPFDIFVESYAGNSAWVPEAIRTARKILDMPVPPAAGESCEYCTYISGGARFETIPTAVPIIAEVAKKPADFRARVAAKKPQKKVTPGGLF